MLLPSRERFTCTLREKAEGPHKGCVQMPPAPMSGLIQPVVNDQGDRVIPGTRRPDGTVRKERRIRPGYTPQDEVQTYQSKGTQVGGF